MNEFEPRTRSVADLRKTFATIAEQKRQLTSVKESLNTQLDKQQAYERDLEAMTCSLEKAVEARLCGKPAEAALIAREYLTHAHA
jgi:hypothetical protein